MATANDQGLDPVTLRLLAAELDEVAEMAAKSCPCSAHQWVTARSATQAADFRTRALKVDAAARTETPLARVLAEVDAWLTKYDEDSKRAVQLVDPRGLTRMIRYVVEAYRATQPVKIDRSNT